MKKDRVKSRHQRALRAAYLTSLPLYLFAVLPAYGAYLFPQEGPLPLLLSAFLVCLYSWAKDEL